MGTGEVNAGVNPADGLASHPGESRNIPSRLHATETGISSGTDGPLGSYADFTLNRFIK